MPKLAINGGPKTIKKPFPRYNAIGKEEIRAAMETLKTGKLSGFFGSWNEQFYGGPKVREFEQAWARHFGSKNAVSCNSLTSGLIAAVGALGIEPGDEVITSPWTMTATATAILIWNAIPVFADIEDKTFNLDPESIKKNITPRTKAIIVPNIFGHAARLDEIMAIAKKHKLYVIEDSAQAPNAKYKNRYAGTIGHIGGFSLNYHKHIHTGEGGMMITDDDFLAERMRLIRNHGEAVVGSKGEKNLCNIIGFNFRLGEIEAAMGLPQLKKIKIITDERTKAGRTLTQKLKGLKGLILPEEQAGCTHVFYIYPLKYNAQETGVSREKIVKALQAEGIPWIYEYYQLLHLQPIYQKKIAYGRRGFPWVSPFYKGAVSYKKGICPNAERFYEKDLICLQICQNNYTSKETDLVAKAFQKVWNNLNELK